MTHFNQDTQTTMTRFTRHFVLAIALIFSAHSYANVHSDDILSEDVERGVNAKFSPSSTFNTYTPEEFFNRDLSEKTSFSKGTPLNFDFTVEAVEEGQSAFQIVRGFFTGLAK